MAIAVMGRATRSLPAKRKREAKTYRRSALPFVAMASAGSSVRKKTSRGGWYF